MRRWIMVCATLILALQAAFACLDGARGREAKPARAATLHGTLGDAEAWRHFRGRFITESGRVVDTANGNISHSEGQGYGMLLAVAADDRGTFERLWGWTRANLMVRDDQLVAWRWEPDRRPGVADLNNAADGDILIAWALAEAAEAWRDPAHRAAARRIAVEVSRKLVLPATPQGPLLLPAVAGFAAEDRADGPVINLSYWVFPAFERLPLVAPEFDWAALSRNGVGLLERSRFGPLGLPAEWTALRDTTMRPADGFPPHFSYNAVRVPLYLLWAGLDRADLHEPFLRLWAKPDPRGLALSDVTTGAAVEWLSEPGYASLADLIGCAIKGAPGLPPSTKRGASTHYYPSTLHLLALVAARMRYPRCARD